MAVQTEQEIIRLYQENQQEEALRLFIDIYQSRLYSLAYRMLGNHDDAVDALQEILLQVNRSLKNFRGQSSLYTWAYRLGTNVCLTFRQKRRHGALPLVWENAADGLLQPIERPNEDPDLMCESKFRQFLVQQAVLQLPESQRIIVVLHDLEGLTVPEAAKILSLNLTAAKARLQRGREALRRIIARGFTVQGMEGVGKFTMDDEGRLV